MTMCHRFSTFCHATNGPVMKRHYYIIHHHPVRITGLDRYIYVSLGELPMVVSHLVETLESPFACQPWEDGQIAVLFRHEVEIEMQGLLNLLRITNESVPT